jgi:transcriptional regulator with GAF, ATPase, and Fis domain
LRNATLVEDLQGANAQLERENQSLKVQLEPDPEIVSRSERMSQVLDLAWRVAETPSTVLLRGESGTGKEVIAKAIHRESGFGDGPFVAVHCAALPSGLLESELFGHEKGAFTDATSQRIGRFELAEGGTIFLDEVGEIGPEVQVKLLRVLQERQFERVGGSETLEVNVRVIAATNRDLEAGVREGTFREDLYYRLNVVPVVLPPLRERKEDVPSLVERFLEQYSGEMGRNVTAVSGEAMELLMAYSWPGNVRELQNLVERMVVVADGPVILPQHLPPELRGGQGAKSVVRSGAFLSLAEIERQHVEAALERCEWNQSEAARALEITRAQLRHRIKQYGIEGDWKVGAPVRKGTGD